MITQERTTVKIKSSQVLDQVIVEEFSKDWQTLDLANWEAFIAFFETIPPDRFDLGFAYSIKKDGLQVPLDSTKIKQTGSIPPCGTTACILGAWLVWKGMPQAIDSIAGLEAFASHFSISIELGDAVFSGRIFGVHPGERSYEDITKSVAIEGLKEMLHFAKSARS